MNSELGLENGLLLTQEPRCTEARAEAAQRGVQRWIRSRVMTALDDLNKLREATFPLVTTGLGLQGLSEEGVNLMP